MLLKELSEARGVSGNEGKVREIIREHIETHVDQISVDSIGNLIAFKKGDGSIPLKVMLAAHMDEIGFMVTHIDEKGYLHFSPVGGIDERVIPGKRVLVGDKAIPGVIGLKPVHLLKEEERSQITPLERLVIDIGAGDRASAEKVVSVGDCATFDVAFQELGFRRVRGKAFDDRAGCAVLVELVKERFPFDLYAVFTVQEEVGLRGAKVAAYAIEPDVAFSIEGTVADDLPKDKDVSPTAKLGHGPAITLMDRTFVAFHPLVRLLVEAAEAEGIPYQFKQPLVGGTDSGAIHLARKGVPSATVAVPCRYIHSPLSILSLDDLENTLRLMKAALRRLRPEHLKVE
ncbi:MAG: M42 family metallopeptidase [Anaerolineae bacterium]|nr:M42 family metallopeptidase [Anaerolineae bacterium]MDW8102039.1 M42 family metallopeptidase [Anaerolineae bacterium]